MTASDPLHESLKHAQNEIALLQNENHDLVRINNSNVAVLNRLWDVSFRGRDKEADALSTSGRLEKIQAILREHLRGMQDGVQST